jgi:hypothetical protein
MSGYKCYTVTGRVGRAFTATIVHAATPAHATEAGRREMQADPRANGYVVYVVDLHRTPAGSRCDICEG